MHRTEYHVNVFYCFPDISNLEGEHSLYTFDYVAYYTQDNSENFWYVQFKFTSHKRSFLNLADINFFPIPADCLQYDSIISIIHVCIVL